MLGGKYIYLGKYIFKIDGFSGTLQALLLMISFQIFKILVKKKKKTTNIHFRKNTNHRKRF